MIKSQGKSVNEVRVHNLPRCSQIGRVLGRFCNERNLRKGKTCCNYRNYDY